MIRHRVIRILLVFTFASLAPVLRADYVSGNQLVQVLRGGGYTLLMRHASSPHRPPDAAHANPDNKNAERQLDESGRATARELGEAIRALKIPIGEVLSSPTYRALETVHYAELGKATTFAQLGDSGHSMQSDPTGTRGAWLLHKLIEQPSAGTNTVIVTHLPNIVEALGREWSNLKDGETLVVRTDGNKPVVVAKIAAEQWSTLDTR